MRTINIHEAKTQLSRLVEAAASGEEIVIAKAGKPVARLVPLKGGHARRRLGGLANRFPVPDTFDEPLPPAVLEEFEKP